MDHGKRLDKYRRAGIQIIDQSRDENKRKDIDKHQAVRAQADGRPMKLQADSIFHALIANDQLTALRQGERVRIPEGRSPLKYLQRLSDLKPDAPVALGRLIDDMAQAN